MVLVALLWFVPPAGAATRTVSIFDGPSRYMPKTITINKGDTVKWTNRGTRAHTASKDGGGWTSGTLSVGESFSKRFTIRGTIRYHCNFHAAMKGTIVVQ
jgi:plastocyanin